MRLLFLFPAKKVKIMEVKMNNTTPQKDSQAQTDRRIENVNRHALDMVSIAAIVPLSDAVFTLSPAPLQYLSRLHGFLSDQYKNDREQESINLLYFIYGLLGIEYADAIAPLRKNPEAASYFVYQFTANLGELIEELEEKPTRQDKRDYIST
jgi:hypothetical protein